MPDINKLKKSIETIHKYRNITPCNECLIEKPSNEVKQIPCSNP